MMMMIVNSMLLWHHLHRQQELHCKDYANQLLMLEIWILDEEFITGSFVGFGENKQGQSLAHSRQNCLAHKLITNHGSCKLQHKRDTKEFTTVAKE